MFIAYFFERKDSIVRVVFVSLGIECAVMAVKHWCGIFFISDALKCVRALPVAFDGSSFWKAWTSVGEMNVLKERSKMTRLLFRKTTAYPLLTHVTLHTSPRTRLRSGSGCRSRRSRRTRSGCISQRSDRSTTWPRSLNTPSPCPSRASIGLRRKQHKPRVKIPTW